MKFYKDYEDLTWIGTIIGPYGTKGALKVKPETDTPKYYVKIKKIILEENTNLKKYLIETFSLVNKQWRLILSGVNNREDATKLKGRRILINDNQLKPLSKNEFFLHQLLDCKIYDEKNKFFGNIENIIETGANLVLKVRLDNKIFLVPMSKDVILRLEIDKKKIIIKLIPGLFN